MNFSRGESSFFLLKETPKKIIKHPKILGPQKYQKYQKMISHPWHFINLNKN